ETLIPGQRLDVAIVSHRVPREGDPIWRPSLARVRVTSTPSLPDLDALCRTRRVSLAVLDTAIQPTAGGFDAVDAAGYLWRDGERSARALLWVDSTASSEHVAEEVARVFRERRFDHKLLGAACPRADCASRA